MRYSFKVFLIPQVGNHPGQATQAVEFVRFDPDKPEDMNALSHIVALIKPQQIPVANPGKLKPSNVCRVVQPAIQTALGDSRRFSASYHHARACDFFAVRPPKTAQDPRATRPEFCQYDEAHRDYVYTQKWVDFLKAELVKPGRYEEIFGLSVTGRSEALANKVGSNASELESELSPV